MVESLAVTHVSGIAAIYMNVRQRKPPKCVEFCGLIIISASGVLFEEQNLKIRCGNRLGFMFDFGLFEIGLG